MHLVVHTMNYLHSQDRVGVQSWEQSVTVKVYLCTLDKDVIFSVIKKMIAFYIIARGTWIISVYFKKWCLFINR